MEFLAPFNGILARAPCGAACPTPPRFRSQAFSTSQRFPGKLEFHGLVSCRNRSWVPPFRAFPSQRVSTSLEATCSLAVRSPACRTHRSRPFAAGFRRLPRAKRGRLASPADYELPFHGARPLPGRSGPRTALAVLAAGFIHLGALFPLRIRSRRSGLPRPDGRCSPGFLPLQSSLSNLGSSTRPDRSPNTAPSPEDSGAATPGTSSPRDRVRPSRPRPVARRRRPDGRINLVGGVRPPSRPARTTSRWRLLLPWPSARRSPAAPDLRSFQVSER
jgi:hypothetical protein